jgi:hypothetical protein
MLILVAILALLPVVEGGPTGLFPLLRSCKVNVELNVLLCGTVMAFDVSLLAMTDITGAFAKSFSLGNLTPIVDKWRHFLLGFVKLGCTPYLVFDSHVFSFGPKVVTQQARRATREKYESKIILIRLKFPDSYWKGFTKSDPRRHSRKVRKAGEGVLCLGEEKVNLPPRILVTGEGAGRKLPASVRVTGPHDAPTLCWEAILELFSRFFFKDKLLPAAIHLLKNLSLAILGTMQALNLRLSEARVMQGFPRRLRALPPQPHMHINIGISLHGKCTQRMKAYKNKVKLLC